jgi:hypothetical protein
VLLKRPWTDCNSLDRQVTSILVCRSCDTDTNTGTQYCIHVCGTDAPMFVRAVDLKGLLFFKKKMSVVSEEGFSFDASAHERILDCVCNLVTSLLIHLEESRTHVSLVEGPARKPPQKTRPPGARNIHKVTAPVVVDAREIIRLYSRGERNSPLFKSYVRGFHYMQVYGPRNSLRKRMYRKPLFRNDPNAPLAIRPHVIRDPSTPKARKRSRKAPK